MTRPPGRRSVRRVLVALDASPGSLAAASAAARLARLLEAELAGLFVEDLELLALSRSPLAHQVHLLTAAVDELESHDMERQIRVQAARARRALAQMAERAGISWSFRVARGAVALEIRDEAGEGDLVSLGHLGWSLRRSRALGRTARAMLSERNRCTLLIPRGSAIRTPVLAVYDGTAIGDKGLELAATVAGPKEGCLFVLTAGAEAAGLSEQAGRVLGERAAAARFVHLGESRAPKIARVARRVGGGLVVAPLSGSTLTAIEIQSLVDELDCPLLALS